VAIISALGLPVLEHRDKGNLTSRQVEGENTRHGTPLIFQYTWFHSHINKEEDVQGDVELEAQKVSRAKCNLKVK
jgi:hypothetical protein